MESGAERQLADGQDKNEPITALESRRLVFSLSHTAQRTKCRTMTGDRSDSRKKRSKLGCFICRKRKVRCDEIHPICGACLRLKLTCTWASDESIGPKRMRRGRRVETRVDASALTIDDESSLATPHAIGGLVETTGDLPKELSPPWWPSLEMVEGFFDVNWSETFGAGDYDYYHQAPAVVSQKTNLNPSLAGGEIQESDSTIQLTSLNATPRRSRDVTLVGSDRPLMHHFTTAMVRFCILRNCVHDNLYSYIMTNMGLFHRSLFDAMMAWSGLHLAYITDQSDEDARQRYDTAYMELIEDLADDISPALLLTTIWFLMQYQLILAEGVESFCELINLAADVVKGELDDSNPEGAMSRIGPIGSLVLVWMSARDNQASYLGYGGKLLGCLKMYPHIYELVDKSSVSDDAPAVVNWIPRPGSKSEGPTDMQACMRLSLRNVTVAGQIKILGRGAGHTTPVSSLAWESVHSSLAILHKEVEQDPSPAAKSALAVAKGSLNAMPTVTAICYNRLLLLGSYYTSLIHYNIYRPRLAADEPWLLPPEECADRIIRMCQRVTRERSGSPQGIWPTHVFIAGITTKDPVYQSWAIHTLELAEKWGQNIMKTRKLLEAVIKKQNLTGTRVDFLQVMKDTTGLFIV